MSTPSNRQVDREQISKIIIVGGGSAGWICAAELSNILDQRCTIQLVESEEIGTVGVGEATIPPIRAFNRNLGIDESEFVKATQGTFKLGIEFIDWNEKGHRYFHPFGRFGVDFDLVPMHQFWLEAKRNGEQNPIDSYSLAASAARKGRFDVPSLDPRSLKSTIDYAYHFDASLYAAFLRNYAEERGVERIEGRVEHVDQDPESGFIDTITMSDGRTFDADFFIDCTGFRKLLISTAGGEDYVDWSHWLPCNKAVAAPSGKCADFLPYTKATAQSAGWQWKIPLQHRTGNGYVYCDEFTSDENALDTLLSGIDGSPIKDPFQVRFQTGHRRQFWVKNCLAIGLAAGFMEPLESTSIHLIQSGISRFLALFPRKGCDEILIDEYNRLTTQEYESTRDFLVLHYKATSRRDTEMWRYCASMDIPDTLKHRIELFRGYGRFSNGPLELFQDQSWLAVLVGMGVLPNGSEPLLAYRSHIDGPSILAQIKSKVDGLSDQLPTHQQMVDRICA